MSPVHVCAKNIRITFSVLKALHTTVKTGKNMVRVTIISFSSTTIFRSIYLPMRHTYPHHHLNSAVKAEPGLSAPCSSMASRRDRTARADPCPSQLHRLRRNT